MKPYPYGIPLSFYVDRLTKVPAPLDKTPVRSFSAAELVGNQASDYLDAPLTDGNFEAVMNRFPLKFYNRFSVDQIMKVFNSSFVCMHPTVEEIIHTDPRFELVYKVGNSIRKWGCGNSWNEIVDGYEALLRFSLNIPGFDVRLDHSTYFNERGYSKYSREFLDGVFAYNVMHGDEHVMTIGFSIAAGHRLLVQQVQLVRPKGNRWLFRWPANRIEHVLDRFRVAFQSYNIFLVDGASSARLILKGYRRGLTSAKEYAASRRERLKLTEWKDSAEVKKSYQIALADIAECKMRIDHLKADATRLMAFYANAGRYRRTKQTFVANGLKHHRLAA